MKANHKRIGVCLCLLVCSSVLYAGEGERGYIGVMLDAQALPPLLTKHLGLAPDQGLRIKNVNRGTPADKVGLERDDIIIGLNGKAVTDHTAFIDDIIQVGAGNAIELEIVHEGKRKLIVLSLAARTGGFDPKFPPEPDVVQEWRPGKVFHFDSGKDSWIEIEEMGADGRDVNIRIPVSKPGIRTDIKRFLKERYVFHYADGDSPCAVTIDGDPHDSDTTITVEKGDKKFSVSVDAIDTLPANVQDQAQRAVKQARESARKRTRTKVWNQHSQALEDFMVEHPPEEWKGYTDKVLDRVKVFIDKEELPQKLLSKDKLDKIEEHLEKLSTRMEKLEKELMDKLRSIHSHEEAQDEASEAPHQEEKGQDAKAKEAKDGAKPVV